MKKSMLDTGCWVLVAACCLLVNKATGQVPSLINYQGRLLDGTNLVNGNVELSLRFYKQDVGGPIAYEDSNTVAVVDGLYSTLLGDNSVVGTLEDIAGGATDVYLETVVNGVVLTPREQVGSSLFALMAGNVVDGAVTSGKIAPGAVTAGKLGSSAVSAANLAANAVTGPKIAAGTISNSHIAAGTITSSRLVQGPGSGVDADLLDGRDSTAFLSTGGGTMTGALLVASTFTANGVIRSTNGGFMFPDGSVQTTAASGLLPWTVAGGTSVQAQANSGYIVTNEAQVVIYLPSNPPIGSIVRVVGTGLNGWLVMTNGAVLNPGSTVSWTPHAPSTFWRTLASSADGVKLVGASDDPGPIFTSTDSGSNWTARAFNLSWKAVASSANGNVLVAVHDDILLDGTGRIYTSADAGGTWTPRDTNRAWSTCAMSAVGDRMYAGSTDQGLFASTNIGVSWTQRMGGNLADVACSADGLKVVVAENNGFIFTSHDGGTNWTQRDSIRPWRAVASSTDGGKLVAVAGGLGDRIYTSTDSGTNWVARDTNRLWVDVASSSDGVRLVAVTEGGQIYLSSDSGVTWTPTETSRFWKSCASSADGLKLVAGVGNGFVFTTTLAPSPSLPAGSWQGGPSAAIELLHVGQNRFAVLSSAGAPASF